MKTKLILTTLFLVFYFLGKAQLYITTDSYQNLYYNIKSEEWLVESNVENPSLFALGNDMKNLLHAMGDDMDVYNIIEWEYHDEKALYEIIANTDEGFEYVIFIDGQNLVLMLYTEIEGKEYMVRHNIIDVKYEEAK